MTDFRNLTQPHDLRSQLGLKNSGMTDERRISLGLPPLNEQNQESLRAEIADALRRDVKPLSPDEATPDPLHKIIAVTGCTNQAQARRIHKWFEGKHQPMGTSNVVVNVVNNGEPPTDQNASEIVANIRKMIDSPEVRTLRQIGEMRESSEKAAKIIHAAGASIQVDETSMTDMSRHLRFDARALARLVPSGIILIKDMDPADYVDQFGGPTGVVEVTYDDIKSVGVLTVDQASVLRGCGLYAVGGYFLGGPVNTTEPGKPIPMATNAPTHRHLSKIHDHVESLESDILEALVMAEANPHADRRRLESARTQFELSFMMMKKAVDPEQERQ